MRHIRLLCVGATAILGACAARPDLPDASVPPVMEWRDAVSSNVDTVDPHWWDSYGDPALSRLVHDALARNDDLALAATRVEEARAQFSLARAQRMPILQATLDGGRERSVNAFGLPRVQTAGDADLTASYELDLFGRLKSASEAAKAALLSSESARDSVRLAVVASAAGGYIALRSLDARLIILRETLEARRASLHYASRRTRSGYATSLEEAQAQADFHATEQQIPVLELAIRRQEDGLSVLVGHAPGLIERGKLLDELVVPPLAPLQPAIMLRRRPDIAQAESDLVAADHQLDAARAAFMPSVRLGAIGGYVASTLLSDPIWIFSLGGSVLAPLFEGGRLEAQEDIATARRKRAAFAYRKAALNAFREVEDALAEQQHLAEQEQSLTGQRDASATALRVATNRYRAGYSPYLEQLDAQRGLLAVELARIQARADRLASATRLFQVLGGGWTAPDDGS